MFQDDNTVQYYHPYISRQVDKFNPNYCHHVKFPCKGMGLLSKCDLTITPWYKVDVDLIRPWSAKKENFSGEFYALTCIYTTTILVELVYIDYHCKDIWKTRLACYLRLMHIIHNNGGEFTGDAFTHLLHILNIKDVSTTSKNPQSNTMCKCMHQTIAIALILTASNTTRCSSSCWWCTINYYAFQEIYHLDYLNASLGALGFSWDMLLNLPFTVEWQTISHNREALVNNALMKTNQKCINYYYNVGQCILKFEQTIKGKLAIKTSIPFESCSIIALKLSLFFMWYGSKKYDR